MNIFKLLFGHKHFAFAESVVGWCAVWVAAGIFAAVLSACGDGAGLASDSPGTSIEPTAVSAGPSKTLVLPESRTDLQGSAPGVSVTWSQLSGPARVVFKSATMPQTAVMADQAGVYVLRLTASDTSGGTKTSDMTLTVKPNAVVIGASSTPLNHLQALVPPAFKKGHTLLPLSKSSCAVADPINIELMKHWGYSGQFGGALAKYGVGGPLFEEVKANPGRYPIEISYASFYPYYDNYSGTNPDLPKLPDATWLRDASGKIMLNAGRPMASPAAPDEAFIIMGEHAGKDAAVAEARLNQPITLITNAGESGVWIFSEASPDTFYKKAPAVVAHFNGSGLTDWNIYNSRQKARHEHLIKEGILRQLKKSRPAYSVYQDSYGPERGRWGGWRQYVFYAEEFFGLDKKPLVSDYSSPEMYFNFHNSGWSGIHEGSAVPWDGLTQALRNAGGNIKLGQRNIYPWVSLGWDGGDSGGISDNDLFLGMMKTYYTAGAIGAVSGYFTCDGAPFQAMRSNTAVGSAMPTQVRGAYLLGHVHALFSHLEEYLRNGDLLPGPDVHPYKAAADETAAMEFPAIGETKRVKTLNSGEVQMPTARVVARKITNQDRWLVTAWANTGNDRDVRVMVDPRLGELTLKARRSGSVYIAEIKNGVTSLRLVDEDGMNPTRTLFP